MNIGSADQFPEGDRAQRTPLTLYAIAMLILCILVGGAEGYDVQAMALAAPLVRAAWGLTFNQVGALLSVSAIGLVLGSFLLSPLGDSRGRRPAILLGLLIGAVGTGTGAIAVDMHTLLLTRLIAGLGLGLALPNVLAIAMELMPRRLHTLSIVLVSCGYPVGSAIGAALSSRFVPQHGHAAVFAIGGLGTTAALILCLLFLAESPSFLANRAGREAEMARTLRRLGRKIPPSAFVSKVETFVGLRARLSALFSPERRTVTAFLWAMNFGNIALVYFFFSWLPSLIAGAGLDTAAALRATSLFSAAGAVGALLMAFVLPRIGPLKVLTFAYVVGMAATVTLASATPTGAWLFFALAMAGGAVVGSQFCLSAVVAQAYPAAIRATASGFATGIGRAGAVITPVAAGALIGIIGGSQSAFLLALAPATIALIACLCLLRAGDLHVASS